ncbi:hypothetical protein [Pseudomonas sp. ArH3a]|uniref:hypothetical protein n=1 Tax=Pseudomonas sp. ArH3a TaxID=2862945 RepID=UPI001F55EA57|nr:hypothetical protein [Pseudomonas sp. ArH3a]
MNALPSTSLPKHVSLLGYGGLLPFIFLALLIPFSLDYQTSIGTALRCGLISFDSTMHSNLSVGMPLDLLVYRKDSFSDAKSYRITHDDPYFVRLRTQWAARQYDMLTDLPEAPGAYMMPG